MRFPAIPPAYDEIINRLAASNKLGDFFRVTDQAAPGGYPHWEQLRRMPLPQSGTSPRRMVGRH
jgi:hypothetical protein